MNERLAQLYREAGLQPAWQRTPEAQPGYTPPRPRPRQMRPAIQRLYDPNQGVRDQAGAQVRQERELAALSDRAMGGYSGYADRNQVEEFGRGAMEMTGAPAWARGIQDVQNGRPGEAIPEFLWGALNTAGIAALPLGGGARPATPPRVPRDLPSRLRVYHGSPHQFDQFDAARIGSGEGAQAYGHGLYVAEADDVGQAYRQQLSGPDGGYLYEGYLSGRPSEFIDLDAPVANQPRRVQEFISELYELPIAELRRRRLRPVIVGEAEAQRAQQAGFAGLRYLDEGSRASGRGTRNYVVFDPNRVEWDVRNGALTRPPPNAANAYRVSEGSSSPANTVIAEPQLPPQVRSGPNAQALPEPIPSAVRPQRPPATASPDAGSFEAGLHLRQDDAGNWFVADRTGERQSEHIFGDEIGARAALSNMRSGLPEMGEIRMLPDGDFGGRAPTQLLPDGSASGVGQRLPRRVVDLRTPRGETHETIVNPSEADILRLTRPVRAARGSAVERGVPLSSSRGVRYIKDTEGNIYVGNSYDVTHHDLVTHYGLSNRGSLDGGEIVRLPDGTFELQNNDGAMPLPRGWLNGLAPDAPNAGPSRPPTRPRPPPRRPQQ